SGGLTLGRTGFAPAGRQTKFPEVIASSFPFDPHCLVALIFLYSICFTAKPTLFPGFRFHGAFRSREMTWGWVQALVTLLKYVGHLNPRDLKGRKRRIQGGYVFSFRQVSESWVDALGRFFEGKSTQAMEALVLALIENAGARRKRRDVQDHLDA